MFKFIKANPKIHKQIKYKRKEYPWPCAGEPGRKIMLFDDDILLKNKKGTYDCLTGIYKIGIQIPDKDVKPYEIN